MAVAVEPQGTGAASASAAASLLLGPLLRHVGARDATVWVETDRPCRVEVRCGAESATATTFQVNGHSYALVVVGDLEPGSCLPYTVHLDGRQVWPLPDSPYPPSVIRTVAVGGPFRLLFGSCRSPVTVKVKDPTGSGDDVLGAYARRMAGLQPGDWPHALLMLGDQVYADETSPATREFIAQRRDPAIAPYTQVADFEEYTRLYAEAWGDPDVRWLLSTMPTSMIFDDHDVLDDWNTSAAWRTEIRRTSWWNDRIAGAFMSYWIYQHLGNLSPRDLDQDELYQGVLAAGDAGPALRAFAERADREADGGPGIQWSYRRDFGAVRLLMIDSRAGRVLTEGQRSMVGETEFAWLEAQVDGGGFEHLVIGTSVPWLLPRALHDVESFDEAITAGSRGATAARLGERARRAVDLEHWAAFRRSFDRLLRLIVRVGRGEHGGVPPATICVVSGDVHHTYVSEAQPDEAIVSRVFQLTCSPFHNSIPLAMRLVFTIAWHRYAQRLTRWLARLGRVPPVAVAWSTRGGPYFGNYVAQLTFDGASAVFALEKSAFDGPITRATPIPEARLDLTADRPKAQATQGRVQRAAPEAGSPRPRA